MAQGKLQLALIEEMVTNYKTKQYLSIVTNTINPMKFDAQSVWFDINALKTLIDAIESETAQHPQYDMHNFGIRFYYSSYPDSDSEEPTFDDLDTIPSNYEKLHTLIAIPTAEINGVNSDFDPFNTLTYNGTKPTGIGCAIMAENHGNLTPPGSQDGLWF
jgi:hypothetical protein